MRRFHSAIRTTVSSAAVALTLGYASAAYAQNQPDDPEDLESEVELESGQDTADAGDATEGAIIVTGSRIRRPNIDSTVPITSVGGDDLVGGGEVSLGDALNQLPALRATFSQANSTRFIGTAGLNLVDLRGLGSARTLVLVNGRRHVSSTPGSYSVDINTIPIDLLERVDVVTGGNSAIYGSDAVSGVINFILRRDFEGIELDSQMGISDERDRESYFVSATVGRNFWDDRANIAFSAEYARQQAVFFGDRESQTGATTGFPVFARTESAFADDPNVPDTSFFPVGSPGQTFSIISLGGTVLTICPAENPADPLTVRRGAATCSDPLSPTGGRLADNYMFVGGQLLRNVADIDLRPVGGPTLGGLGATGIEDAMLLPGLERIAANLLFNVEISPAFRPFLEAKFVRITATQTSTQPTFVNSSLSPVFFLDNPFLTEEQRQVIRVINGFPDTAQTNAFTFFRFNNDIGTRAEDHERNTYRVVGGVRGDISQTGNWNYEVTFNYGYTDTYYETGGNVHIARFNAAANAARDPATGQIVCRVNIDANPANDQPGCVPINLFGFGSPSQEAINYVLHTSSREQWAKQVNAVAYVSGDSSGFFELPGGPIGVALGLEYRSEDAYSDYDDVTQSGATFLNSIAEFDPPSVSVKEIFGELRIPILADMPGFQELTLEGAARYSDYSSTGGVWAYNVGLVWSPVRDLRFRGGYARAVRAPDLGDLFATQSQTFANNVVDPCSQGAPIQANPNRARNCAEHGIPTTITLPDGSVEPWVNSPTSGISGFNSGNPNLQPEVGISWTVGAVIQPRWVPNLSLTIDYFNIEITDAIAGLTGQAIINRCYDDPVSTNNPFCDAVFRRSTPGDPIADFTFDGQAGRRFAGFPDFNIGVIGPGFLNQPFNFQSLKTSGIDFDLSYRDEIFEGVRLDVRAIVSWLINREQFTFITDPERSVRLHGTLGDPEVAGQFRSTVSWDQFDVRYTLRFLDRMTVGAWETQFSHQGRPPENEDLFPVTHYPRRFYHDIRFGFEPEGERFRFEIGVDNVTDQLPPFDLTGTGAGSGVYPVVGRFFYAGARIRFD